MAIRWGGRCCVNWRDSLAIEIVCEGTLVETMDKGLAVGEALMDRLSALERDLVRAGFSVLTDEPMSAYTTYEIGGPADLFVVAESERQLLVAVGQARKHKVIPFVLGGGANLLVADAGIRGLVVAYRGDQYAFRRDVVSLQEAAEVLLWTEAGAAINARARESVSRGLEGLEWAVDLPGTVGGAIVGNAGAYGGYICDCLRDVRVLEPDGLVCQMEAADVQ